MALFAQILGRGRQRKACRAEAGIQNLQEIHSQVWDVQQGMDHCILYASGPQAEILHELRCGSGPNLINLCRYTEIAIVNLAKTSVYINCMSWGEISLINCLKFRIGLNVHFSFVKAEQQFQNENDFGGKKTKTKGNK